MVNKIITYVLGIILVIVLMSLLIININKMEEPKQFMITGGTFDLDAYIIITDDTAYAASYATQILSETYTNEDFKARGLTLSDELGTTFVIWLPIKSADDTSIVHHELLHLTYSMLHAVGIELSPETEEVYTYQLQYLSKQFYNQINKIE
jgi:hypothetical protein